MSMTASMMAWATCTPFGPNSRARDWLSARTANLPAAKVAKLAEPRTEAVAPVMIRDGGYFDSPTEASSNGSVACAKLNSPSLVLRVSR